MSSERQIIDKNDRWWGEHVHRYQEALKYIKNTDKVLDIACGTGFGTAIIASATKNEVVGGDLDPESIALCTKSWSKPNLNFKVIDGTAIAFDNHYFDVIVSFETLEHTTQYKKMLSEFKRVLKPNGILILSTPNQKLTSPNGVIFNPYHTQEFHYEELQALLNAVFKNVELLGQYCSRYNDHNTFVMNTFAKRAESFFLLRGVRKLPYSLRSSVMKIIFGIPLYNQVEDFSFSADKKFIEAKCPVLFTICKVGLS